MPISLVICVVKVPRSTFNVQAGEDGEDQVLSRSNLKAVSRDITFSPSSQPPRQLSRACLITLLAVNDPVLETRRAVRELTETTVSADVLRAVDRYFTQDATIVHPMLNSPQSSGRDGVKAAYKMLKVLTYNNKITFHAVGFDKGVERKGVEHKVGLLDLTEDLQLRFIPLPSSMNPTFHLRFLIRLDLVKNEHDHLWRITKQEDNLPTDFGSTGLKLFPGLVEFSNAVKWMAGMGTLVVGTLLSTYGIGP